MFRGVSKNMNSLCIITIIRQLSIKDPKLGELEIFCQKSRWNQSQDENNIPIGKKKKKGDQYDILFLI
jgi:hypothetical protein